MSEYNFTTCGICGDKILYAQEHDCWVRRKFDTQDVYPEPPSEAVVLDSQWPQA